MDLRLEMGYNNDAGRSVAAARVLREDLAPVQIWTPRLQPQKESFGPVV